METLTIDTISVIANLLFDGRVPGVCPANVRVPHALNQTRVFIGFLREINASWLENKEVLELPPTRSLESLILEAASGPRKFGPGSRSILLRALNVAGGVSTIVINVACASLDALLQADFTTLRRWMHTSHAMRGRLLPLCFPLWKMMRGLRALMTIKAHLPSELASAEMPCHEYFYSSLVSLCYDEKAFTRAVFHANWENAPTTFEPMAYYTRGDVVTGVMPTPDIPAPPTTVETWLNGIEQTLAHTPPGYVVAVRRFAGQDTVPPVFVSPVEWLAAIGVAYKRWTKRMAEVATYGTLIKQLRTVPLVSATPKWAKSVAEHLTDEQVAELKIVLDARLALKRPAQSVSEEEPTPKRVKH
jgi:hypothetical protein